MPGSHEPAACPCGRAVLAGSRRRGSHALWPRVSGVSLRASRTQGPSTFTSQSGAVSRRATPSRRLYPPSVAGRGSSPPVGHRGPGCAFRVVFSILWGGHPGAASRGPSSVFKPAERWSLRASCGFGSAARGAVGGPASHRPRPSICPSVRRCLAPALRSSEQRCPSAPLRVTLPSPSLEHPLPSLSAPCHTSPNMTATRPQP